MPAPSLRKMAKDADVPYEDAERYWREAKQSAKKQGVFKKDGEDDYYSYIMGIVKKRMGLAFRLDTAARRLAVFAEL